ncbi:MAG: hypothetical protein AB7O38_14005 [Pirellulaceae bacterium]
MAVRMISESFIAGSGSHFVVATSDRPVFRGFDPTMAYLSSGMRNRRFNHHRRHFRRN